MTKRAEGGRSVGPGQEAGVEPPAALLARPPRVPVAFPARGDS